MFTVYTPSTELAVLAAEFDRAGPPISGDLVPHHPSNQHLGLRIVVCPFAVHGFDRHSQDVLFGFRVAYVHQQNVRVTERLWTSTALALLEIISSMLRKVSRLGFNPTFRRGTPTRTLCRYFLCRECPTSANNPKRHQCNHPMVASCAPVAL